MVTTGTGKLLRGMLRKTRVPVCGSMALLIATCGSGGSDEPESTSSDPQASMVRICAASLPTPMTLLSIHPGQLMANT